MAADIDPVALELADLRQQLADERRQHDITRGELERTRLVRDDALRDIERLRDLLRRAADEPNIDKARALADAELLGPNARLTGPKWPPQEYANGTD